MYTFGGANDEIGYDIVDGENGSLIILTSDRTTTLGSEDICLLQVNADRRIAGRECFGTDRQDYPYSLLRTKDGGLVVSGTRWKSRRDAFVRKLDRNFNTQWEKFYDGGAWHHDEGFVTIETADGGYLLSGMTRSSRGVTRGSTMLLKLSSSGEQEWVVHEEVDTKNYLFDVLQDRDGNYVSVGVESGHHRYTEFEFYAPSATGVVYKHDADGEEIWRTSIGGEQNDWLKRVVVAPQGGYYLLGSTQSLGAGSFDFYLVKIDPNGQVEWEKTYGDFQFDYGRQIRVMDNGDVLLAGTTCLDDRDFETDVLLIRTDSEGNVLWQEVYGGHSSEDVHGMLVKDDRILIVGEITDATNADKDVLLLDVPLDATVPFQQYVSEANELKVYPNPAESLVNFDLTDLPCSGHQLNIYDQLGRTIVSSDYDGKSIELQLSEWPAATYFYVLTSGCYSTQVGKLRVR